MEKDKKGEFYMEFMKEVEELIQRYADAVHTQDEKEFKSLWTLEETNIEISGTTLFNGIESIYQDFLIDMIQKKYSSIYLINDGLQAYLLTDDVAVAVFKYHTECIIRESGKSHRIAGLETQVLKKTSEGWKIAHIQYHGKEIAL